MKLKETFGYLRVLVLQLLVSFLCMTIIRVIFHFSNLSKFDEIGLGDYLAGSLFDIYTIGIFFIPYYCFFLLPFHKRSNKIHWIVSKSLFHITNTVLIILNVIDVEFYKFTLKRSGYDVVQMMSYGSDFGNLIDAFFLDYWMLVILGILLIVLSEYLLRKIGKPNDSPFTLKTYIIQFVLMLILIPSLMIMGRGGIGLRPVGIMHAGKYTDLKNIPFVLNTGFTFIKSINDKSLEEKNYFEDEYELKTIYNPIKDVGGEPLFEKNNVVILIMESFSQEFIGKFSGKESYTPFLDSLTDHSRYYPNFWSNGKRSIQALPAIINSIPALSSTPYISSNYSSNNIESLPQSLKNIGYNCYFFHGASNGSMNFQAYCEAIGFDEYYGRDEYGNENHFDGNWGIYDEYFLPWSAEKIPSKEPFLATIFSLSSHHPYKIPKHHKFKFKEGPEKIYKAINYSDYCLSQFFEEAKKQDWYENTLFIITADHTADSKDKYYGQRTGQYSVPLILFHPSHKDWSGKSEQLGDQIDIYPTIMDLVSPRTDKIYSLGSSLIKDTTDNYAINFGHGVMYFYSGDYLLVLLNDNPEYLIKKYDVNRYDGDNYLNAEKEIADSLHRKYKAIIQTYSNDMIRNQMVYE